MHFLHKSFVAIGVWQKSPWHSAKCVGQDILRVIFLEGSRRLIKKCIFRYHFFTRIAQPSDRPSDRPTVRPTVRPSVRPTAKFAWPPAQGVREHGSAVPLFSVPSNLRFFKIADSKNLRFWDTMKWYPWGTPGTRNWAYLTVMDPPGNQSNFDTDFGVFLKRFRLQNGPKITNKIIEKMM